MCEHDEAAAQPQPKPRQFSSRRAFLKGSAASLMGLGMSGAGPVFLRRAAWAADGADSRRSPILVVVFQRGAMDGLMAVPPLERALRGPIDRLRPNLSMTARGVTGVHDLGVGFGLHPSLGELLPLWRDGQLGIVQAVGSPDPTRSHFDAQDFLETATPGIKSTRSGWLDRVVGELGHESLPPGVGVGATRPSPVRAVALADALPRSLQGGASGAVAFPSLEEFRLGRSSVSHRAGSAQGSPEQRGLEALYAGSGVESLRTAGAETFEAIEALSALDASSYRPAAGVRYPDSPLGNSLRQVAQLIKGDVGLEIAFTESGGWDTHVRQGTTNGSFARRSRELGDAIAALWRDLGAHRSRVVVMSMTEFGRTVSENGSAGTDHGRASCMFVLGEQVLGGRVHGRWPGLEREHLDEGRDLAVTTDFRSVFAEVAAGHLGVGDLSRVFPGWSGRRMSLLRT